MAHYGVDDDGSESSNKSEDRAEPDPQFLPADAGNTDIGGTAIHNDAHRELTVPKDRVHDKDEEDATRLNETSAQLGTNATEAKTPSHGKDKGGISMQNEAIQHHNQNRGCCNRIIAGYASVVVRFPWLMILVVFICSAIFAGVSFTQVVFPDFSDPIKGFEARGTYLKGAQLSHDHLRSELATFPQSYSGKRKKRETIFESGNLCFELSQLDKELVEYSFVKFVFSGVEGNDLFSKAALQEVCDYERQVVMTSQYYYGFYWNYNYASDSSSCRGLSLGHMVGLLAGNIECAELTEQDVAEVFELVKRCAPLIKSLYDDTDIEECNRRIYNQNMIFIITQFLVDSEFLQNDNNKATYSMLMHPYFSFDSLEFYQENIEDNAYTGNYVELVAFRADIKFELFNEYVTEDLYLFIIATVAILFIMVLYLRSFVVTIATLFNIGFSFVMSYFLYHIVFRLTFFPFMNLLSGLVLIAVSADDVFVFTDIWLQQKAEYREAHAVKQFKTKDLCMVLTKTFKHASLSIFVTSLSTAAAFLANMVSEITSIKCFGLFSALCIMCNFVFMITWVPAIILLLDKITDFFSERMNSHTWYTKMENCFQNLERFLSKINTAIFERFFPFVIAKLWILWILLLVCLGIGGFIVIFATPKLSLPTSEEFQFFSSSNLLEVYDFKLRQKFHFFNEVQESEYGIRVAYVFGVIGKDNGNHFDPNSTGSLTLDSNIRFSDPKVIDFLTDFCNDILEAPFVSMFSKSFGVCSLTLLKQLVSYPCTDNSLFRSPCCNQQWPLNSEVFDHCALLFMNQLNSEVNGSFVSSNLLGIPYYQSGSEIKAFVFDFASNQDWTSSFNTMEDLFDVSKMFLEDHLENGPAALQNAFVDFYGAMDFYDLQKALSQGTYMAIGISLLCALIVMLLSTFNLLISLYAILSITLAISVTIGVLVLLGWELNILESITITLAVGLSIDFTIHYGVAYMICTRSNRSQRVHSAFKSVGSAVAMAALTTFVAGAAVVSSKVLSYSQLGTFLMLVMALSWIYATFLFQSLCYRFGPEGRCMQIPSPFSCFSKKGTCQPSVGELTEEARSQSKTEEVRPSLMSRSKPYRLKNETDTEGLENPAYSAESFIEVQNQNNSDGKFNHFDTKREPEKNEETFTSHL